MGGAGDGREGSFLDAALFASFHPASVKFFGSGGSNASEFASRDRGCMGLTAGASSAEASELSVNERAVPNFSHPCSTLAGTAQPAAASSLAAGRPSSGFDEEDWPHDYELDDDEF